jgi:hypothetical protein
LETHAAGVPRACEQAILNEAGRTNVALIEAWELALSRDDRAVLAAFAEVDRLADLDR